MAGSKLDWFNVQHVSLYFLVILYNFYAFFVFLFFFIYTEKFKVIKTSHGLCITQVKSWNLDYVDRRGLSSNKLKAEKEVHIVWRKNVEGENRFTF